MLRFFICSVLFLLAAKISFAQDVHLKKNANNDPRIEIISLEGNTFIGDGSGQVNTGYENTTNGYRALYTNTSGYSNTALGYKSMFSNTSGPNNTACGAWSLVSNTTGYNNTSYGSNSLYYNTSGFNNTALGRETLLLNTTGSYNTASGYLSMFYNTTGINNTSAGALSLRNNTTGHNNSAMGYEALYSNTTGFSNVALGSYSLYNNTIKSNLVAIGDSALYNNGLGEPQPNHATRNTAVGSKTLFSNTGGNINTAIGYRALYSNTTGVDNTANGVDALYYNTTGYFNTANGVSALYYNTTGTFNTVIGRRALFYNTTGHENTACGHNALYDNTEGDKNTAMGMLALINNETGLENSALGHSALYDNNGSYNTSVGAYSLDLNSSGSFNTSLGYKSDVSQNSLMNATSLGANASVNCSNCMVLGSVNGINGATSNVNVGIGTTNPSFRLDVGDRMRIRSGGDANNTAGLWLNDIANTSQPAFIGMDGDSHVGFYGNPGSIWGLVMNVTNGNTGIGTSAPAHKLHVVGNGYFTGTVTASCGLLICSDIRYKNHISPLTNALNRLLSLEGIYYYWNKEKFPDKGFEDDRQIGFAAQELEKIFPEIVHTDEKGYKSVDYSRLSPVIVEAIKEQQAQIETQKKQIVVLEKLVHHLINQAEKMENR